MEEKKKNEQNNKPATSNSFHHPKKGEPGYDEFMRNLFKKAASNMLRNDEI